MGFPPSYVDLCSRPRRQPQRAIFALGLLSSIFAATVAHGVTTALIGATGMLHYGIINVDTDSAYSAGRTVM